MKYLVNIITYYQSYVWWPWILFQVSENEPWKIWLSLHLVKDKIAKENTRFRKSISVEERLVLTLRYLATGMSQQSLSFAFRIGKSTVGKILAETYQELYTHWKIHIYEHRLPQMIGYVFQNSLKIHGIFHMWLKQLTENTSELNVLNSQRASTTIIFLEMTSFGLNLG